jgi:hypothetical protein
MTTSETQFNFPGDDERMDEPVEDGSNVSQESASPAEQQTSLVDPIEETGIVKNPS